MQTEGLLGGPNPPGMGPDPTGMGLRDGGPQSRVGVAELLEQVLELGASDLHLTAGAKPTVRVNGRLGQLEDYPVLQPAETQAMIYSILTQRQRERLESEQASYWTGQLRKRQEMVTKAREAARALGRREEPSRVAHRAGDDMLGRAAAQALSLANGNAAAGGAIAGAAGR